MDNTLMNALENESNASIMDLTSSKVKSQKNDILQQLQLPREKLKILGKSLDSTFGIWGKMTTKS